MTLDYLHPHAAPFSLAGDSGDGVLLLHGWTGSPAHLRLLAEHLNAAGHAVEAPVYAGHGTKVEDMLTTGWREWVHSAAEGAQRLIDSGRRLHVVGLSMGGLIGVLLASSFEAASLTTINTPQRIHNRVAYLARLVKLVRPIRGPGEPAPPDEPEAAEFYHQYHATPLKTIEDLLLLVRAARRALPRVHSPLLVIQSLADETVRPVSAEMLYERAGSRHKSILWLDDARHVATLDPARHTIHDAILRHIERARRGSRRLP